MAHGTNSSSDILGLGPVFAANIDFSTLINTDDLNDQTYERDLYFYISNDKQITTSIPGLPYTNSEIVAYQLCKMADSTAFRENCTRVTTGITLADGSTKCQTSDCLDFSFENPTNRNLTFNFRGENQDLTRFYWAWKTYFYFVCGNEVITSTITEVTHPPLTPDLSSDTNHDYMLDPSLNSGSFFAAFSTSVDDCPILFLHLYEDESLTTMYTGEKLGVQFQFDSIATSKLWF